MATPANGYTFFPMSFTPEQVCKHDDCQRLTTYGEAQTWHGGEDILIHPYCWEHGYYSGSQKDWPL